MDFIYWLNLLAGAGIVISIPVGLAAWNRLGRSGRWTNSKQAMNDQDFLCEFVELAQKEGSAASD